MAERSDSTSEATGAPGPSRRQRWLLVALVFAATAYPPAASLGRDSLAGAFRYFAGDAFYYLSVADHSQDRPYFTFDGSHPTNGFHPLWQILLSQSFTALELDPAAQIGFTAITGLLLVALGTALFAWVLHGLTGRAWLALLAAVPGVYFVIVPTPGAHQFARWAFANGMESPLSIFCFGVALVGIFSRGWLREAAGLRGIVLASCVFSAVVLSRLDDVFLFAPFLAWAALAAGSGRERLRRLAAWCVPPSIAIGVYLLYNWLEVGQLLPSSGAAKAQPLFALARNLYALWMLVLPFADPLGRGPVAWSDEAWRLLQMLVPAALAAVWLARRRFVSSPAASDRRAHEDLWLALLAGYVLLKAIYNFSMVGLWHQGQWYYPLSIMTFDLIVAVSLARWLDARAASRAAEPGPAAPSRLERARLGSPSLARRLGAALPAFAAGAGVLVMANAFVAERQAGARLVRNFDFWLERDAVRRLVAESCDGCGVLEFDDGIVGYSLGATTPTLHGLGLVLDAEAREAQARGRLLELAFARGHRLFASVNYEMPREAYASPERLREALARNRHFEGEDLDRWEFEVAFESPGSGVPFVSFRPRGPLEIPLARRRPVLPDLRPRQLLPRTRASTRPPGPS